MHFSRIPTLVVGVVLCVLFSPNMASLPNGSACNFRDHLCNSQCCADNVCVAKGAQGRGATCSSGDGCECAANLVCEGFFFDTCEDPDADPADRTCNKDTDCESRCCPDTTRICAPKASKALGDSCSSRDGCECAGDLVCLDGECTVPPTPSPVPAPTSPTSPTTPPPAPTNGGGVDGDPHMQGLRGQKINWSGVDGGWYSLVKDDNAELNINIRLTAPLPDEFPDRQLVTGLTVMSEGHSLVVEVKNPYTVDTDGCPKGVSPCLVNGGLRIVVDGQEVDELLRFSRQVQVADGAISVSASNLPVECRQFGVDKLWGRMYQEMLEGRRELLSDESFEDWILSFDRMPAHPWCAKYIAENDLADLQSIHAIFKIDTPTVTVRLSAGTNHQGDGELDWDGRVLPDLEFWQMDVGMDGLDVDNPALSGILGKTARPVYDENGKAVMEGFKAFRGTVEDYRVSGALGTHFALLEKTKEGHE